MNQLSTEVKTAEPKQTGITIIQYPSVVDYDSKPGVGLELAETYGHLKDLDPDSIKAYKELKEAIKTVRTLRTTNQKQEDFIKKPLNGFKDLVIDTGKKIRAEIKKVEDRLTAEKERIDGVKADRKAALEKVWRENLATIQAKDKDLFGSPLDAMESHLADIVSCNIDDYELGDYEEEAKASLANARMKAEQSIAQEKQRLDLVKQQAALKLQQEEQAKKEKIVADKLAADKRIADDKAAAQQKIIDDMLAEKAEREKKALTKQAMASPAEIPSIDIEKLAAATGIPATRLDYQGNAPDISDIAEACGLPAGASVVDEVKDESGKVIGVSVGYKDSSMAVNMAPAKNTSDFDDDPAPIDLQVNAEDYQKMINYMAKITAMIESTPVDFASQECARSMNRVVENFQKALNYLTAVSKGGKA